jgi:oligopeptidase B
MPEQVPHQTGPPAARRQPSVRVLHGEQVSDDYAWMRDPDDPALHDYLISERAYYDAQREEFDALARTLAAEAAARFPAGAEYSVAWPRGGFLYRTRVPQDSDNLQLLRTPAEEAGEPGPGEAGEQVLLDENVLAARTGYVEVGVREPSHDGALLAWSADSSGAETYELRIRDLRTGEDLPEAIARSYPGVAWSTVSECLFYLVPDELHRPYQVWRHRVGTQASADALVFEEPDQRFDLTLNSSRSGEFAIITAESRDTTEVRLIPLDAPLDDPVLVEPRHRGVEYRVDHARDGTHYIVTDAEETEFTLMRASLTSPARANWTAVACGAIAPARTDTRLIRCDVLRDHLVLTLRRDGAPLLAITDHDGANVREILPGMIAGSISVEYAEDYDRGSVIIAEQSLIEPPTWYELDLSTAAKHPLKQMDVPDYESARYRTERTTAPASDGTPIPVTLAYAEGTPLDGSAPCLLYGYGAYEAVLDPEFDRSLPSLLDRGVVYAVAHIRGGGERGRNWWHQGRLRAKPTTFTDHIAVADWLAGRLVDGSRIVSRGMSAGGLLQGAVYSMRPDRWRAVVAEVPFVDVVTTMLDASIPLTVNEWDEWGDPRNPDDYACMRSYAPYENPPSGPRPALLVTGAVNDARVMIHEPAKWVAKLRATDTAGSRTLFRAEVGVGAHGGPSGRTARLGHEAEIQAFILDAMGIRS